VLFLKKRIKRAVDRNRAKRKIYAFLGKEHPKTPSYFIYPTKTMLQSPHTALAEEMRKAFATL
jgi:ribonuclease P protein component